MKLAKIIPIFILFVIGLSCLASYHDDPVTKIDEPSMDMPEHPRFLDVFNFVFLPKCLGCHHSNNLSGGLDLSLYNSVMLRVVPGQPMASKLFISTEFDLMPPAGEPKATKEEKAYLKLWIEEGAIE